MHKAVGALGALALLAVLAMGHPGPAGAAPLKEVPPGPAGAGLLKEVEVPDAPDLDEASYEDLVADAQRQLRLRGFDPGPIDGQLGLRTRRAIRDYQAEARSRGVLEALKGPADPGGRPELVRMDASGADGDRR